MDNSDLLYNILELSQPWKVLDMRDDLHDRQIDVWVGVEPPKKNWIFGRTPHEQKTTEYVWRHVNLAGLRCVIHASLPTGTDTSEFRWCGDKGVPFTRLLALHVAALMSQGLALQHICAVLDISVEDLWKFRHRLNTGEARLSGSASTVEAAALDGDEGEVPDAENPIWESLLDGTASIDIRILSMKLMLARMREQMRGIKDKEVRTLKVYELQRYVVRNKRQLAYEIGQLRQRLTLH